MVNIMVLIWRTSFEHSCWPVRYPFILLSWIVGRNSETNIQRRRPTILLLSCIEKIVTRNRGAQRNPPPPSRKNWMIYRGPGFLSFVYFGSPPPLPAASCLSFSVFLCVAGRAYWREGVEGGRCQIIRRRESMVLYKSFNTLCLHPCFCKMGAKVK